MNKLTVIGAGAMAEALISGMIENQLLESKNIWVTNRSNKPRWNNGSRTSGTQGKWCRPGIDEMYEGSLKAIKKTWRNHKC